MSHTVTVYRDAAGEWRWTRTAENGETVADSAEGYANRADCAAMAVEVNGPDPIYQTEP